MNFKINLDKEEAYKNIENLRKDSKSFTPNWVDVIPKDLNYGEIPEFMKQDQKQIVP